MAFCANCGEKIQPGNVYCSACGSRTDISSGMKSFEFLSQQDDIGSDNGTIKRCPSCGSGIPSFVAICPCCGNEMRSTRISETLHRFVVQVNLAEEEILLENDTTKKGWQSWGIMKKIGFLLLNIPLFFLPLVLYLVAPLFRLKATPYLTQKEQGLVSVLENFPIPNDRESILETLVYAKEKIDFLSKEKIDRKSSFWIRQWYSKAEQLKEKADLMFPNDRVVKHSFEEIKADMKRVNQKIRLKAGMGVVLLGITISLAVAKGGELKKLVPKAPPLVIPESELTALIPRIDGASGKIVIDSDAYFVMSYYKISGTEFGKYKKRCLEKGFTIDNESDGFQFKGFNADGVCMKVSFYDGELHIRITNKIELREFSLPNTEIAAMLPKTKSKIGKIEAFSDQYLEIYIGDTSYDDFSDYVNFCIDEGFDQKISKYEKAFYGSNREGYHIRVQYEGFRMMFISIDKVRE